MGGTRVAFVIGQQHLEADEFSAANGWELTRYRDTELDRLANEFDHYQVVIWGSLAGYEKNLPWAKYNQALRKYIENGGIFIVLDGNYDAATTEIFGSWGGDFQLKRNPHCAMRQKDKKHSPKILKALPVNNFPYELYGLFDGYPDGWSHFESLPRQWQVLAQCPDGAAFMIMRRAGKGTMAVLAYAMFNIHERQVMLEALASNLLAAQNLEKEKSGLTEYRLSDRFGDSGAQLGLTGNSAEIMAEVLLNDQVIASQKLNPGKNEIPFAVNELGKLKLIVKKRDIVIASKHAEVMPPISLAISRYTVYPLIAPQIRLYVKAAANDFQNPPYRIDFFVDGKPFAPGKLAGDGVYQADFSSLSPGEHVISARLVQGDKVLFNTEPGKIKIMTHNPRVAISPTGVLQIEGKPFFPIGLYHVSRDHRLPLEKRDEALRFAAENGYNTLHVSIKPDESAASFGKFLQAAQEHNIMILPESDSLALSVQQHAAAPAILGWNIGDEPDLAGISAALFQQRLRDLKTIDAEHPSYTVFMDPASIGKYWPVTEMAAVDPYPVPRFPLDTVYKSVASARDTLQGSSSNLVAVLQGFGYESDPIFSVPTSRQLRNMLYQALVAGAKGVIFYTYEDGRFYLPDHPELCGLIKSVPAELKALEAFLLHGEYRELAVNSPGVYAAEWKTADATLQVLVNTMGKTVQPVIGGKRITLGPEAVQISK